MKQTIQTKGQWRRQSWALRTLAVAVVLVAWQALAVPQASAQTVEEKGKTLIDRNTNYLFDMAHFGANTMTMKHMGTTQTLNGFNLQYHMTWISSVTKNKNTTDWTFEFDKNGRFLLFRMTTSWPTGGFEPADLAIAVVRESFLNHQTVKNAMAKNPNLRAALQNANARQLTATWLSIDQDANP